MKVPLGKEKLSSLGNYSDFFVDSYSKQVYYCNANDIDTCTIKANRNQKGDTMKDSKNLYTRSFPEYRLSDEDLKSLQNELLGILVDIKAVCDKHHIDYMLCGGTTLGAIRHKGFIPWDDDVDLMMLRSEFCKFKNAFMEEFSDRYEIAEPLSMPRYYSKIVKIFKKGTTYIEIPTAGIAGPDMIFVDLFLIENVPSPGLKRKLKAFAYDFAFRASSVCLDYKYPSLPILEKSKNCRELKNYYSFRRFVGWFFSLFGSIQSYIKICESLANQQEETGWVGIPSDSGYLERIYPREFFSHLGEAEFCGYKMKIPEDYDKYLRAEYGDYMQIPPPENREIHSAYKISFSEWKSLAVSCGEAFLKFHP